MAFSEIDGALKLLLSKYFGGGQHFEINVPYEEINETDEFWFKFRDTSGKFVWKGVTNFFDSTEVPKGTIFFALLSPDGKEHFLMVAAPVEIGLVRRVVHCSKQVESEVQAERKAKVKARPKTKRPTARVKSPRLKLT